MFGSKENIRTLALLLAMIVCLSSQAAQADSPCTDATHPGVATACSCEQYLSSLAAVVASARLYWVARDGDMFRTALAHFERDKRLFGIVAGFHGHAVLTEDGIGDESIVRLARELMAAVDQAPVQRGLVQLNSLEGPISRSLESYHEAFASRMAEACRQDFIAE